MTRNPLRTALHALIAAAFMSLAAPGLYAQDAAFPSKPITLVIPFPPGGATDITARPFASKLQEAFDKPVIVENKPGAGGNIGSVAVRNAAPDGYTILLAGVFLTVNPAVSKNAGYDPVRDFIPLGVGAEMPIVLIGSPTLAANSIQELIALAKAKPNTLNGASIGSGSLSHLVLVLFNRQAKVDIQHVPYPGSAKGKADVMGGRVEIMFDSVASALPQIQANQVKALAITSPRRINELPNVPTVDEIGVSGVEAVAWNAFFVPAKTPKAIVDRLSTELRKIAADPAIRSQFASRGLYITSTTPEAFATKVAAETAKWSELAQASGARMD